MQRRGDDMVVDGMLPSEPMMMMMILLLLLHDVYA